MMSKETNGANLPGDPGGTVAPEFSATPRELAAAPATQSSPELLPEWKIESQPEGKLFGRYNELVLLLIGFGLTSVLGFWFQHRVQIGNERRASQEAKIERELAEDRARRDREAQFLADTLFRATQVRLQLRQDSLNRIADAREVERLRERDERFRAEQNSLARLAPLQGAQLDRAVDLADDISGALLASWEASRELSSFWSYGDSIPPAMRDHYDVAKRNLAHASEQRARMRNIAPMRLRLYFGGIARLRAAELMGSLDCLERVITAPVSARRVDYDRVQTALDMMRDGIIDLNEYLITTLEERQRGIAGGAVDSAQRTAMEKGLVHFRQDACAFVGAGGSLS